jgi:hypothetical protein
VYKKYPVTRERKCNGYKDLTGGYSQDSIITPQDVKAMGGCSESFSVDPSRISKARGLEFDLPIQSDSCPFGYVKVARTYHSTGITKYTCVREQYPVDKEDEGKLYSDNGVPFKMRLDNGFYAGNEVVEAHLALQKGRTYNDHEFSETGFNHVNPGYSMTNNYLPITSPPPPPRVSQVVSRESALGLGGQTPYIASEADKPCRFSGYSVNPHTNSQIVYYPPSHNPRKHQRYTKNPVTSSVHL